MARTDLHFRLRIPPVLKVLVEEAALANNRSMTAEIIARLERSFPVEEDPAPSSASMAELPADLSVEELSRAVEAASRAAIEDTFRRLGVVRRSFPEDRK